MKNGFMKSMMKGMALTGISDMAKSNPTQAAELLRDIMDENNTETNR